MSCILFVTNAFNVTPSTTNAVQYIQSIFLTTDGSNAATTEISLDGTNGNWDFAGTITGTTICLPNDPTQPCRDQWPTGGTGSDIWSTWAGGKIYYNTWNVGVGTATPSYKLDVNWSGRFNNNLIVNGTTTVNDNVNFNVGNAYASRAWFWFLWKWSLGNEFWLMWIADDYIAVKDWSTYKYGNDWSLNILSNGNVGIGTPTPSTQLDIVLSGSEHLRLGDRPSDSLPRIASTSTLDIFSQEDMNINSYKVSIWSTHWIYVEWGIMWGWNVNRVGIGTDTPNSLLHVAQSGKAQFGDNLFGYSNSYNGIIQSPVSAGLVFNTNGANTRMFINASWYVGINQVSPTANLEVVGTVKMLTSIWDEVLWYTGNNNRLFPQWVTSPSLNTWLNTDSIWYIECNDSTSTWLLLVIWYTWDHVWSSDPGYVSFIQRAGNVFTYNLKAGETFVVIKTFMWATFCSDLTVRSQQYGKNPIYWPHIYTWWSIYQQASQLQAQSSFQ